ncbi:hypothetical protein DBZ36_12215 [Alginatibacterium sediminis]|uniref:Uncharacterized protein n=1 Tax=Alginatibacterium sediminis TaxID=2164068 RepID=A0A420EBH2_9ALTE|nr:hypothetical protein [Alginatibacterium sediminis]RKF18004.1 hypothetical protein DBZ36_12215 [Alginatibacterium sediminis]
MKYQVFVFCSVLMAFSSTQYVNAERRDLFAEAIKANPTPLTEAIYSDEKAKGIIASYFGSAFSMTTYTFNQYKNAEVNSRLTQQAIQDILILSDTNGWVKAFAQEQLTSLSASYPTNVILEESGVKNGVYTWIADLDVFFSLNYMGGENKKTGTHRFRATMIRTNEAYHHEFIVLDKIRMLD